MITSYYAHGTIDELDSIMCDLKKHLFILAIKLKYAIAIKDSTIYSIIENGCLQKTKRFEKDAELEEKLNRQDVLSFTELKELKDRNYEKFKSL